jgi:hypothetical protein
VLQGERVICRMIFDREVYRSTLHGKCRRSRRGGPPECVVGGSATGSIPQNRAGDPSEHLQRLETPQEGQAGRDDLQTALCANGPKSSVYQTVYHCARFLRLGTARAIFGQKKSPLI